jgi:hypothetical protein
MQRSLMRLNMNISGTVKWYIYTLKSMSKYKNTKVKKEIGPCSSIIIISKYDCSERKKSDAFNNKDKAKVITQ